MKKIVCLFLLLSFCSASGIRAASSHSVSEKQFSSLNKSERNFVQNDPISDVFSKDSGVSNDHSYSKKRKRGRKGLLPGVIRTVNEFYLIITMFEIGLTWSYKIFYLFHLHFVHGERGPPFTV